ncbi:MAG: hypothetical protein ABJA57_01880 [Ginsengibacter sp.]
MVLTNDFNIDHKTIRKIGLKPCDKAFNDQVAPHARVFKYPFLENVFIMESDLYGNPMPKKYVFLAFFGTHGLIGRNLSIEKLKRATVQYIRKIVERNKEG